MCGPNGSFYVDLCDKGFNNSYERFWLDQKFEPQQFDDKATHFARIAPELSNLDRVQAQAIADTWLKRDIVMQNHNNRGDIAALTMLKQTCRLLQKNAPRAGVYGLPGSDYFKLGFDRLTYEAGAFLYEQCKSASFQGCYNPVYRFGIDTVRADPPTIPLEPTARTPYTHIPYTHEQLMVHNSCTHTCLLVIPPNLC